jgi:hypothetical protein
VNRFRFVRLCEQLQRQREALRAQPPHHMQPRPMPEYAILADVLHAHGMSGYMQQNAVPLGDTEGASPRVDSPVDVANDPRVRMGLPPRHIRDVATACSWLEGPWFSSLATPASAPRSRSNSTGSLSARSATTSSSATSSTANTPRATNPWSEYTNVSDAAWHEIEMVVSNAHKIEEEETEEDGVEKEAMTASS